MTTIPKHEINRDDRGISRAVRTSARSQSNASGGDLIDQTLAIWQKHAKKRLTREDGREIVENMTGFFRILQEWDRADRARLRVNKS